MFGFAQKAIRVIEDMVFLIGQAADTFEGLHGQQGVALAYLGQVAAVEQLQKLDGEFDVANAAVPGLDLGIADAGLPRLLFDPTKGLLAP